MTPKKTRAARKAPGPTKEQLVDLNQELNRTNEQLRDRLAKALYGDTDKLFAFDVMFECAVNHDEMIGVPDPTRLTATIKAASPKIAYYTKTYTVLAASPGEALNAAGPMFHAYFIGDVKARGLKVVDKETFVTALVKPNTQFIGQVTARGDITHASRPVQG